MLNWRKIYQSVIHLSSDLFDRLLENDQLIRTGLGTLVCRDLDETGKGE
jgi:hypothetical protein